MLILLVSCVQKMESVEPDAVCQAIVEASDCSSEECFDIECARGTTDECYLPISEAGPVRGSVEALEVADLRCKRTDRRFRLEELWCDEEQDNDLIVACAYQARL